jgi:hypothetical protein
MPVMSASLEVLWEMVTLFLDHVASKKPAMLLKNQLDTLSRMDFYISHNATGTPEEFSQKLGISKRMLYHYLKFLKEDFKAPIYYNRRTGTYHYRSPVKLNIGYEKVIG